MNNDDLCIRFSNTVYATKADVSKILKISSIDDIWNRILSYRSSFNCQLLLRNIEKTPYSLTFTPSINERLNNAERKLTKAVLKYAKITEDESKYLVKKEYYARCLRNLAEKYNLHVTDEFLFALIEGNLSTISPSEMIIANYYRILKFLETHYVDPIDHHFCSQIYSMITGQAELEDCYRQENLADNDANVIIGKTYNSAPVERIIPMMENLFDFVQNEEVSPIAKAVGSYYLITHIKPFDVYSEEIAIVFMKNVLAHNDLEDLASLLDFERLLSQDVDEVNNILNEVRKTNDLTYLFNYCIDLSDQIVGDLLDRITTLSVNSIRQEYYQTSSTSVRTHREENQSSPIDINAPLSSAASNQVSFEMNVALPTLPVGLDEGDAQKIEEHLVEIYPTLKRGQAYFYARHCTIGKYYTISQYKKLLGCAYETARTSMDNLVDLGFYRKEKLNNKFIYTPVTRK